MNNMSFMEKLLEGVEAEWKALAQGENKVAELRRGRVMSKGYLVENAGDYPVYSSQTANNGEIGKINTFDFEGEFVSWTTDGANAGTVFYRTGKFSITNVCGLITIIKTDDLNYKFLFYWLSIVAKRHVYSGMGNPKLMSNQVAKIQIPIPCPENPEKSLQIQTEIVRILDTFTELTAELTARKKQYNYYRDQLLSFEDGEVEWKALGDLTIDKFWIMPATPKFNENGKTPYITSKNIRGGNINFEKTKFISRPDYLNLSRNRPILAGDILISMIGTIGEVARVKAIDLDFYGQNMYLIRLNEGLIHSGYFLHFFDSPSMKNHFNSVKNNSGQGYLKANDIEKLQIPIPCPENPEKSLEIQTEIVRILDKFDTLTHSISEGLPREIEMRQQQYEYYRDLLLSFPKTEAEVEKISGRCG